MSTRTTRPSKGCEALGYEWSTRAQPHGCDPTQCGYCVFGCRAGGKQIDGRHVSDDARGRGTSTIIARCRARRLMIRSGSRDGSSQDARNRRGSRGRGNGARDTRRRVRGRNRNAGVCSAPASRCRSSDAIFSFTPRRRSRVSTADPSKPGADLRSRSCRRSSRRSPATSAFGLEAAPTHPGLLALAAPWTSARAHRRLMQRAAHVCRDDRADARLGGRASSHPRRRQRADRLQAREGGTTRSSRRASARRRVFISPPARTKCTPCNARRLVVSSKAGRPQRRSTRSTAESRASRGSELVDPFSAHQMGTCRMGSDGSTAVCDERGQVFGVSGLYVADASAFPASSGVNPMITVMAIATCVAEGIANG